MSITALIVAPLALIAAASGDVTLPPRVLWNVHQDDIKHMSICPDSVIADTYYATTTSVALVFDCDSRSRMTLKGLDLQTGSLLWNWNTFRLPKIHFDASRFADNTPTFWIVSDDLAYVRVDSSELRGAGTTTAFDPSTGKVLWAKKLPLFDVLADGMLVARDCTYDHYSTCVFDTYNASTAAKVWSRQEPVSNIPGLTCGADTCVHYFSRGTINATVELVAMNVTTGVVRWRQSISGRGAEDWVHIVPERGMVAVNIGAWDFGTVLGLHLENGTVAWQRGGLQHFMGFKPKACGALKEDAPSLMALDAATGDILRAEGYVSADPGLWDSCVELSIDKFRGKVTYDNFVYGTQLWNATLPEMLNIPETTVSTIRPLKGLGSAGMPAFAAWLHDTSPHWPADLENSNNFAIFAGPANTLPLEMV